MKLIPLTKGFSAQVDDSDFEYLNQFRWFASRNRIGAKWYAQRMLILPDGKRCSILMHRELMKPSQGAQVDHKNRNGLDNTRENLRLATNAQNSINTGRRKDNTIGFTGVQSRPSERSGGRTRYRARLRVGGRSNPTNIYGRTVTTPEEAHKEYRELAKRHFGEFVPDDR